MNGNQYEAPYKQSFKYSQDKLLTEEFTDE